MKLLELVPGPQTDPDLMRFMGQFCTERWARASSIAKTAPTSSATASAPMASPPPFTACSTRAIRSRRWTRSSGRRWAARVRAVFRTADIAGIDTLLHVADNLYANLPDDPQRELFSCRTSCARWSRAAGLATRPARGSTRESRAPKGASEILAIDPGDAGVSPAGLRPLLLARQRSKTTPTPGSACAR